jgi:hypothetical protein
MHFLTPKQELTIYLVGTTSGFTPSRPQITPRLKRGSRFYNHLLLAVATLPEEIFFKPPTTVEVGLGSVELNMATNEQDCEGVNPGAVELTVNKRCLTHKERSDEIVFQ